MSFEDFCTSLSAASPKEFFPPLLQALWHDAKGNWETAHQIAQDVNTPEGAWVHAYLHRKEGDPWNAGYWYRRAGKTMPGVSLLEEWENLAKYFLSFS